MAVSHRDWELPNSQIWLAEIDINRGFAVKKLQTKIPKYWLVSYNKISGNAKEPVEKSGEI